MRSNVAHFILLCIIYAAFVSLGLPDSVLGVAWPAMRQDLRQPLEALGLITVVLTACSALSSFASGQVLKRLGTGPVVLLSGFLTGGALLGFSFAPSFVWLLLLAIPLGLGAGSVDAGLNHFVAEHYSSRHMNWLHGFWGVGAIIGPIIMGTAIAGTANWSGGYRYIAFVQLGLGFLFLISLPLWKRERTKAGREKNILPASFKPLQRWMPWLAASLFLIYAAIEMGVGLWTVSILVEDRRVNPLAAGMWVSGFYGAIMVGRFATGLIAERFGNRLLVRFGIIIALIGAFFFAIPELPPALSLIGLILLGLGCAPIYPSLMHETPRRFSPDIARSVVGRQVAFAYLGGAIMPAAFGLLAAHVGLIAVMPGVIVAIVLLLLGSEILNRMT